MASKPTARSKKSSGSGRAKPASKALRPARRTSSAPAASYLHGFSKAEQDRLYVQARFLEKSVHAGVDFRARRRLLEVGCGVGAQTEILLERFPRLQIEGVDASAAQLARARTRLRSAIRQGRVRLSQAQAAALPFDDGHFDSAFVCWLLEHLKEPVAALREIHRTLARRGRIYCTEVLNSGFYLHPYSPATLQYWFAFNDHQWSLGGDPFVGGKLANYLLAAGFRQVVTRPVIHHFDNRQPRARAEFIEYMSGVLLSGAPGLIAEGRVTPKLVARMRVELERLKAAPDAVIFDVFIQASAEKA